MTKSLLPRAQTESLLARASCGVVFLSVLFRLDDVQFPTKWCHVLGQPWYICSRRPVSHSNCCPVWAVFYCGSTATKKNRYFLSQLHFLWGAMGATLIGGSVAGLTQAVVQGVTNSAALAGFYGASIAAPVFEEAFKGLGVLAIAIAFRHEFDNVLDGILYGAMVGLGFAWFENILYYQSAGDEGGYFAMAGLAMARGVYHGLAGHATFTALTGLGLGLARVSRNGLLRWMWPVIGLGLGTFSHFVWNTFAGVLMIPAPNESFALLFMLPFAVILLQAPFVALVAIVLGFVWRHENQIIHQYLQAESHDIVTPDQIAELTPARTRTMNGFRRLFRSGLRTWWTQRQREQLLVS